MTGDSIDVARSLVAAWSKRDVDAILELLHDDIEWHPALTAGGLEGTVYRGHSDIRSWLHELDDVWDELSYEIEEVRDIGEGRVLMLGHFHAVGLKSGVSIDQPQGFLFTVRAGTVAVALAFPSHEAALAAAGLPE